MEYTGHGFMQDNDPKHTSRLTMDCNEKRLIDGGIQTIIYYTTNELDPMKWSILLPRCDKNYHYPSQRRG